MWPVKKIYTNVSDTSTVKNVKMVICSDLLQFKLPSMDINNILIVLIYCNIGDMSFKSL